MKCIVPAFVDGDRIIYVCKPGEVMALVPGERAVVAHPNRQPKFINEDGSEELITYSKSE